jgi:hypothetical protein
MPWLALAQKMTFDLDLTLPPLYLALRDVSGQPEQP